MNELKWWWWWCESVAHNKLIPMSFYEIRKFCFSLLSIDWKLLGDNIQWHTFNDFLVHRAPFPFPYKYKWVYDRTKIERKEKINYLVMRLTKTPSFYMSDSCRNLFHRVACMSMNLGSLCTLQMANNRYLCMIDHILKINMRVKIKNKWPTIRKIERKGENDNLIFSNEKTYSRKRSPTISKWTAAAKSAAKSTDDAWFYLQWTKWLSLLKFMDKSI